MANGGIGGTILSSPLFVETVLPFLLIFAVVFAILQKTEILGKGKKQIDSIVALVIGLIVVAFGQAVGIIVYLIPVLAIAIVVILAFMILYGMTFAQGDFKIHWGVQTAIAILGAIVIIVALLIFTGAWDYLSALFYSDSSAIATNMIFIVLGGIAIGFIVWGGKGKGKDKDKDKDK
ncbi:hypothetical protein J4408_03645 [Candidatus Pacearchaeota archaeon]|nr:hypothetical protein [Candidatus Pacearchaeota archaeon]